MFFNSYLFLFLFLPLSLVLFHALKNMGYWCLSLLWLLAASLFFYGYGKTEYLLLLVISILINWWTAFFLGKEKNGKVFLTAGILFNVLLLGYFKYSYFILDSVVSITGLNLNPVVLALPVGISFYTFQQIAFLIDTYRMPVERCRFTDYCLFITFFPKLFAGPIVRHREMMPQLAAKLELLVQEDIAVGITLFVFGLCKKVIIADLFGSYANPVFTTLAQGGIVNIYNCWVGVLSYTFQIYYDFSGYSDMAIGLSRMFGIRLPLNFHSPYKATNMVEFWHRWHITLSRFLRDYLYIPLGGSHLGYLRMTVNLLITMLIGGIWHGAGWNFLWWGAWHGVGLVAAHGWWKLRSHNPGREKKTRLSCTLAWSLTFFYVTLGWVLFRAENMAVAGTIYKTLFALDGIVLPAEWSGIFTLTTWPISFHGSFSRTPMAHLLLVFCLTLFSPNSQELLRDYMGNDTIKIDSWMPKWTPSVPWALFVTTLFLAALANMSSVSEFLYFQF
ncbi:MAG: MBOAT family protein [Deltaproteobacteria bacterium]|nr:MBOAT family protein [Deltaproteobacteria bacterium]